MAAHLKMSRFAARISASGRNLSCLGPSLPSYPLRAAFSNSAMSRSVDRWSPPRELEKPAVPYRTGFQFTARRVEPPPPFLGQYYKIPTGRFRDFLNKARF